MKYKVGTVIEFKGFKGEEKHGIGEIVETDTDLYLVKLLGKNAGKGHKGNGISNKKYKTNDYYFFPEDSVVSDVKTEEIHIARKGNEVHAVLKKGGEVIDRSKAVCSPEDEFDFWKGSSLAYSRLIAHTCENTKADPQPDYYEPKKKFVPHLENKRGRNFGTIGEETPMSDITGKKLHVGDLVVVIDKKTGMIFEQSFVVFLDANFYEKKAFVMGIGDACKKSGEIKGFIVVRQKSYKDLRNGETYGIIKAVLEE